MTGPISGLTTANGAIVNEVEAYSPSGTLGSMEKNSEPARATNHCIAGG